MKSGLNENGGRLTQLLRGKILNLRHMILVTLIVILP